MQRLTLHTMCSGARHGLLFLPFLQHLSGTFKVETYKAEYRIDFLGGLFSGEEVGMASSPEISTVPPGLTWVSKPCGSLQASSARYQDTLDSQLNLTRTLSC